MECSDNVQGPLGLLGEITDRIVGDIRTIHGLKPGALLLPIHYACFLHNVSHMSNTMHEQY